MSSSLSSPSPSPVIESGPMSRLLEYSDLYTPTPWCTGYIPLDLLVIAP